MEQFLITETLIIELLLIASLVAIAVRRLRIPYTVALVVVGLLITFQQPLEINLTPELILALFVPPLVFEAAFHLNLRDLRRNLPSVLLLAVAGVILSTLIVGVLLAWGIQLSLPLALVFGALISATDPVAVVALFRSLGVPRRLSILVESESLFNDGTAIVVFNMALVAALTGQFSPGVGVVNFFQVAIGGAAIGLVLGWLISLVIERVDDYLIETTLTTVLAFGAYLVAERLHFSGVLAVVAAGLVNGNLGPQGMSPTTRIVLFSFWEYVAFLANSLVFLLIGLQVNIPSLVASWQPVLWAIAAVLLSRLMIIYGLSWVANRLMEPIPLRWQHIINWGGLRGAISLALALSLPVALGPNRELLQVMAFGVVLFTLLFQATTMGGLVRGLRVHIRGENQIEYEVRQARLIAMRASLSHLDRLHREGVVSTHTWERLKSKLSDQANSLAAAVREVLRADPTLEAQELETARREILGAQRSAFNALWREGIISDDSLERLAPEVDASLLSPEAADQEQAESVQATGS